MSDEFARAANDAVIRRAQAGVISQSSRTETDISNKDNNSAYYMQNLEQLVEMGACPNCHENMS